MNIQQIQDHFEIKHLVDHFSNLADEKRVEEQKPLFTEDAVVNTYINGELVFEMQGREQIGQVFTDYLAGFDKVYHLNGQQTVELNGDEAEGITYCQVALTHEQDGKQMMLSHYVRYEDSYRKVDGKWLIAKRIAKFLISEDRVMG
ncbi:SnoaL-like protein [Cricetibacter osteomyelitidis]|uniref:SnoaL-like protein n=1 Tax=Cricetibacter osteomyelitidis TaxID=1521931 RepID=A0A4R2TMA6_9PAST|nr:nuclear transport factor 2 family protein [Cricetibacter osteomyelitidis]TCP96022.1 SnoaL-like protein [Cricetibacter osteomyelitidis]